jgi:large subunit ribosomal protein L13
MNRTWHILDAQNLVLGRLGTQAAQLLMGKHKPGFVRYADSGDYVVVINAAKIQVTGKKETQKIYARYSGYPGGRHTKTLGEVRASKPERIIEQAVAGMLPKNKLKDGMLKRLKVFADEQHPYADKLKPTEK